MIFSFSKQSKSKIEEYLNVLLLLMAIGISVSLLSNQYWIFNVFDQFLNYYLYLSLILTMFFLMLRKIPQVLISFFLFLTCTTIFYRAFSNVYKENINPNFRIYYQNINSSNSKFEELTRHVQEVNGDIVALVESTEEAEIKLASLTNYTTKYSLPREDNYGFLILAKTNFQVEEVYERFDIPLYVKIYIEKYKLRMYLVHFPPPLWKEAWEIQKDTLNKIAKEINTDQSRSFLIVGDLNMSVSSTQFQDFYRQLSSKPYSQELINSGTWPSIMPPYFRISIDHVLSDKKFNMNIEKSSGSDHKSMVIKMAY